MYFIKCELCGEYGEPNERNVRLQGVLNNLDLCDNCIEEEMQRKLQYDANECNFDSVEEYLFGENYTRYLK